jgi:hypothetical protein
MLFLKVNFIFKTHKKRQKTTSFSNTLEEEEKVMTMVVGCFGELKQCGETLRVFTFFFIFNLFFIEEINIKIIFYNFFFVML